MIYVFMITFLSLSVVDNNSHGFFIEHQPPPIHQVYYHSCGHFCGVIVRCIMLSNL